MLYRDGPATRLATYQIRPLGTTTRGKGPEAHIARTRSPGRLHVTPQCVLSTSVGQAMI